MQRVVELPLKLPLKLGMVEIARVQLVGVGVHRHRAMNELNHNLDSLALGARGEGHERMFVKAQLSEHAFQAGIGGVNHAIDCSESDNANLDDRPPAVISGKRCARRTKSGHLVFPRSCFTLKRLNHDLHPWIERLRSGDPRALARAISAVENRRPEASSLLKASFPYSGKARIYGLTGAPGAGKSTLVDQLARHYRRAGKTLGVIAVDPTSPYTGGAILGDRIRMQEHHADAGIYIRSMATRGSLGGLARTTADVATVLDASGRNLILIETVGVGQDEVDIVRVADVTVVILVPGMGDDVQTIKAGIMEIADVFVINKSDREGADRVEREIRALQSLATRSDGWTPPVVKTVATTGAGIEGLVAAIASYEAHLHQGGLALKRSVENWQGRLIAMLRDAMLEKAQTALGNGQVERYAIEVAEHKRDPYTLVEEIVGKAGK